MCDCLFWRVFSYVNGADFFFFLRPSHIDKLDDRVF